MKWSLIKKTFICGNCIFQNVLVMNISNKIIISYKNYLEKEVPQKQLHKTSSLGLTFI